ncbi:MAG: hypothetical protein JO249_18610 [Acidobacteria bacterium]|nr:hypothetical protein [Acidobacteriota bacterium]MBV9482736.1 hypothetical protein [Acidobacteriota bacterium]
MPKKRKGRTRLVRKVLSTQPEARDEGPRLIPLEAHDTASDRMSRTDYYLRLADVALGQGAKNHIVEATDSVT